MKKINVFLDIPKKVDFQPIVNVIRRAGRESNVTIKTLYDLKIDKDIISTLVNQLYLADLMIVDVSEPNPNLFYEIGIAHAIGKPVLFLIRDDAKPPLDIFPGPYIEYSPTENGLKELERILPKVFDDFRKRPRIFLQFLGAETYRLYPPYIIDLDKLDPRDFENLCFELLTQMGFKKIEWFKGIPEVDAVAMLPRKDPDGFEYNELWFVFMGTRRPIEFVIDILRHDPEMFFRKILKAGILGELKYRSTVSGPVTILLILKESEIPIEYLEREIKIAERRIKEMHYPLNFRVRLWSPENLVSLIQQYPHIAYKYFSEESRAKKRYRKTPEQLYRENVELAERLQIMVAKLEEEKKRRFIAERDAAWKDVAFKAAHKLGNPLDAIETFLESLKRRIGEKRTDEALEICKKMERSIEEAKNVIAQFKSLTKVQEINPKQINIKEIIEQTSKIAEHKGVKIEITSSKKLPEIYADPDRILEVFNELFANSFHWFDKEDKIIKIKIQRTTKPPLDLDPSNKYIKVVFEDNGKGVPIEEKEKIFAPFFTTYPHGTGLGLAMVKWVIEALGGTIYEDGKPGEGARFNIFLPIKGGEENAKHPNSGR